MGIMCRALLGPERTTYCLPLFKVFCTCNGLQPTSDTTGEFQARRRIFFLSFLSLKEEVETERWQAFLYGP